MASKFVTLISLLLALNLLFLTTVSSTYHPLPPRSKPKCPCVPTPTVPTPAPPKRIPTPTVPTPAPPKAIPTPTVPTPAPPKFIPTPTVPTPAPPKVIPTPTVPTPAPPKAIPTPTVPTPEPPKATCPRDTLKLGVCADVLKSLLGIVIGTPPQTPCCSLIEGLADADAAVCLCTAIKAQVLGIQLDVPVSLSVLLNYCGKKVPSGFQCA